MSSKTKKVTTTDKKAKPKGGIDWAALGYKEDDEQFVEADKVVVNSGPTKFKVQAGKVYRVGFPFVAPGKDGLKVRIQPVEHLKYYDEDTKSSVKFVMPKNEKLHKQVIDIFTSSPVNTHYLTPVIVYDTNDEGKLLSRNEISYSMKVIAIPAGRYAKLKEASEQFSLSDYDFMITLDGDEKTEGFQKMNFKAVTSKKDLNAKTATWQKGGMVILPDDEDEEAEAVSMDDIIAEAYALADDMISVLGTKVLSDSKIKTILSEWSEDEDEDEEYADEDEEDEYAEEDEEDSEDEDEDPEIDEDEEEDEDEIK